VLHDGPPVTPRPSASVLVLRGRERWEVLMMRRPGGAEFAPGAYVFPGGSVHPEDARFADHLRAAGARELFEELGVLLARTGDRCARDADCRRLRRLLEDGVGWAAALEQLGLRLALDRLAFLARWITPEPVRRRFDTRFYVARLPAGQREHPQPDEVTEWLWIRPRDALERLELVFATRSVLELVAEEPDAAALIRKLRRRRPGPVVIPRIEPLPGGRFRPVPELYHPETLERLPDGRPQPRNFQL
jgi:recombination protein RecT